MRGRTITTTTTTTMRTTMIMGEPFDFSKVNRGLNDDQ
jgi:hypothetical protein